MKRTLILIVLTILLAKGPAATFGAERASREIIDSVLPDLVQVAKSPVVINAVKAENAKRKTPEQIAARDREWLSAPGLSDFMKQLIDSECGRYLRDYQRKTMYFSEIIVMDNQGAIVAITAKTTDYWQGDEAKFVECFKGGKGDIYIGNVEFDKSAQKYLVHVSVPVRDGETAIGCIAFGIDIDMLDRLLFRQKLKQKQ